MAAQRFDHEHFVEMNFEIKKEDWSEYELSDGTMLRIRPIVIKIFRGRQPVAEGSRGLGIASMNIVAAKIPESLRKTQTEKQRVQQEKKMLLEFKPIKEVWNEFKLDDGSLVKLRLIVSRVVRTPEYNSFGEPVYVVTSTNVTDIMR